MKVSVRTAGMDCLQLKRLCFLLILCKFAITANIYVKYNWMLYVYHTVGRMRVLYARLAICFYQRKLNDQYANLL